MGSPTDAPPLKLLFFTVPDCASCIAMKKARTVEKFVEAHSNVTLQNVVLAEAEDKDEVIDTPENRMADAFDVDSTPTIIFKHAQYGEVGREVGGLSLKMLNELYEEAVLKRVEYEAKQSG